MNGKCQILFAEKHDALGDGIRVALLRNAETDNHEDRQPARAVSDRDCTGPVKPRQKPVQDNGQHQDRTEDMRCTLPPAGKRADTQTDRHAQRHSSR